MTSVGEEKKSTKSDSLQRILVFDLKRKLKEIPWIFFHFSFFQMLKHVLQDFAFRNECHEIPSMESSSVFISFLSSHCKDMQNEFYI